MALALVTWFLSEIVRFLSGSALWCAAAQTANATFGVMQTPYVIRSTPAIANPIHDVAATDDETLVITFGFEPGPSRSFYREIATVAGTDEIVRVGIPATLSSTWISAPGSDGIYVTGRDWWYATLDHRDGAVATTFVRSDGSRATYVRPPAVASASWQLVVIPGEKPRAIELTYADEETIAREVGWSGTSRSWRLPPVSRHRHARMVAQPLPDERIALLSNHDGISLYVLADEGHFDTIVLRNLTVQQFGAAIDPAGRLAIVAGRNANPALPEDTGTIEAAVIDPANPGDPKWQPLRHDVRVTGLFREVQVVATAEGFAAAWINELEERRIEATDVDGQGHGGPVVDVGQARPHGPAPYFGVQAKGDALLFWWDDGEHLMERRLPASLSGYAMLNDLAQGLCRQDQEAREP